MIYQSRYAAALNGRFKTESISHDPFEGVFTAPVLINITGADNYAYSISENHKFFRLNPLHKSSSSKRISFVPSNCFTHSHRFARVFLSLKFDRWVNEPDPPPPSSLPPLSSLLPHEAFPRTNTRERANKIFTSAHSTTRVHSSVRAVIWLWLAFLKAG